MMQPFAGQKRARPDGGGGGAAAAGAPSGQPRRRASVAPSRLNGGDVSIKAELKEAKKIIKELLGKHISWPFAKPVDVTKFPQYPEVIEEPIDLGTIKRRLDAGTYETLDEFTSALRLVWSNCYTFNNQDPPDDPESVTGMARELEAHSERMLAQIPQALETERSERAEKDGNEVKELKRTIREMQKSQQMMMEMQQQAMKMGMSNPGMMNPAMMGGMMNPSAMGGMGGMGGMGSMGGMGQPAAPGGGGGRGRGGGRSRGGGRGRGGGGGPSYRGGSAAAGGMVPYDGGTGAMVPSVDRGDMSFDQRAQISAGVAKLGANDLSKAVKIIQENMPTLTEQGGEIEVDINALDNSTLWRLHDYLDQCKGNKPKKAPQKKGGAASFMQNMETAQMRNQHQAQSARAARGALGGGDGGASSGGGGGFSGGGGGDGADDDWMSDADSDNGMGMGGGGGGGSGGMWESFQQTKESHQRQQQQAQQQQARQQQAAAAEAARARSAEQDRQMQQQRQRDEQRQREREERQRQAQGGGIDMPTGAANDWDADDFDEYGMGGF